MFSPWAWNKETKHIEDKAFSLLGLLNITLTCESMVSEGELW
jgi:hypothetical protein